MSFDDWVLALHVLSAFSLVAGMVLFWVTIVAVRRTDTPGDTLRLGPIARVGNATIGAGLGGTIIFGVWLAFSYGGYDIWDGWILAALVLWFVGAALGRRTGEAYMQGPKLAQELESAGQTGRERGAAPRQPHLAGAPHADADVTRRARHHHRHDLEARRMTSILAAARPDSVNFPLFVHVLGAMVLVGGLVTATSALAFAKGDTARLRLGYWTLLAVALPGYVIMRIGAQWIYAKEHWDDVPDKLVPTWLDIGFIVADAGALLMIIALIVGGIGMRRLRDGKGQGLLKATLVISVVILAAALVAVWAMAGKPN